MIKLMLVVLLVFGAFYLFTDSDEGDASSAESKSSLSEISSGSPSPNPSGKTTMYKWQDENGVWQFSNREEDRAGAEVVELDGDINIMPAIDTSILNAEVKTKPASKLPGLSNLPSGMTSISGDQMAEMMNTLDGLQGTIDARKAEIDKAVGGR